MLVKLLVGLFGSLLFTALLGAVVWFGGPLVWHHFVAAEAAVQTVQVQKGALAADTKSANEAQANCTSEIAASVRAGAAIAKAAQPVVNKPGEQQLITAAQIEQAIQ